jgi:hypothetical protein
MTKKELTTRNAKLFIVVAFASLTLQHKKTKMMKSVALLIILALSFVGLVK